MQDTRRVGAHLGMEQFRRKKEVYCAASRDTSDRNVFRFDFF